MSQLYDLGKLIAALNEYQEVGATLIGEDEIERCLTASRHQPPADKSCGMHVRTDHLARRHL